MIPATRRRRKARKKVQPGGFSVVCIAVPAFDLRAGPINTGGCSAQFTPDNCHSFSLSLCRLCLCFHDVLRTEERLIRRYVKLLGLALAGIRDRDAGRPATPALSQFS